MAKIFNGAFLRAAILWTHVPLVYVYLYLVYCNVTVPMSKEPRQVDKIVGKLINVQVMDYDSHFNSTLRALVAQEVAPGDRRLISLIRDLMDSPSGHMIKTSHPVKETPQSKEVSKVLKTKENGFFVEVGAFDGERSSNTFWLEVNRGWTGLLIEMDPYFYTQLRGKNRHCWSINACISPTGKPILVDFKESSGGVGKLLDSSTSGRQVPCFPLESLLLALNRSTVDYFSLDVEGFELDVLRTIPFDKLDIHVFSVEYVHGRKESYREFMERHGYITHKDIHFHDPAISMYVDDFIFVRNNTGP